MRESCGILGVYAPGEDVAKLTYFGLYALQHRGQESSGIATADGNSIRLHAAMGLVAQVFTEATFTRAGLQIIRKTHSLQQILARNAADPSAAYCRFTYGPER